MIRRILILLLLPLTLLAGVSTATTGATLPAPHQVVEKATREVLDRIVRDRPVFRKDPSHLNVIIEENLLPYVDFDRIARRIMAKHYQQASADQRKRFQRVFKDSLIRAYGSALADYNDQRFVVLSPAKGDIEPDRATVRMEVTLSDGKAYPISYAMYLDKGGDWKLENLVLNGINLGLTYRNNFAELVQKHGGDIDRVIQAWSSTVDNVRKEGKSS